MYKGKRQKTMSNKVISKLFAYRNAEQTETGLITVTTVFDDDKEGDFQVKVNDEWKRFSFLVPKVEAKPNPEAVKKLEKLR